MTNDKTSQIATVKTTFRIEKAFTNQANMEAFKFFFEQMLKEQSATISISRVEK